MFWEDVVGLVEENIPALNYPRLMDAERMYTCINLYQPSYTFGSEEN